MSVDEQRRGRIRKGVFLTSTPSAEHMVKRTLPDDLQSFESAAALADELAAAERKQAAEIAEIARRLQAVRTQLEFVSPRKRGK